ncbi:MAG: hypothetical protein B6244_09860 [Candidatus Cloacimonetes bacterium 4572_55]|nr:MAG: hypothetical protein B6244_09860 [Candidatus Cloacimonetes bacterium 4572_55]
MRLIIYIFILITFIFSQMTFVLAELPDESHPCLLYTADMVPVIQQRIADEPYATWWAQSLSVSGQGLSVDFGENSSESEKSYYAKHLAFAYMMTQEEDYGHKAAEALRYAGLESWGEGHQEAKSAQCYIQTYDMLAGTDYFDFFPQYHEQIRERMESAANRVSFSIRFLYNITNNNYEIRLAGALGQYALALSDMEDAEDWLETSESHLFQAMNNQAVGDGGYAEGPDYLEYSAECYLPFLYAYHQLTGENFFNDPLFSAVHEWNLSLRLPDGHRPNYDDGNLDYFYGYYLYQSDDQGDVNLWDWLAADERFARSDMRIDAICVYDVGWQAQEPDGAASLVFYDAGTAIMRSDWSEDAVYCLLLGEHGDVRHGGHEQPDASSFILYGCHQILALDSGYISWNRHHAVDSAWNHNLILVNGEGPDDYPDYLPIFGGTDAYLSDFIDTDFADYVQVQTEYRNAEFQRRIFFPDHEFIFVTDRVDGETSASYEWLLHGNGEFTPDENGGQWQIEDTRTIMRQTASVPLSFFTELDTAAFHWNQPFLHTVLHGTTQAEDVSYLTLLYPLCPDLPAPEMEGLTVENGIGLSCRNGDTLWVFAMGTPDLEMHFGIDGTDYSARGENALIKSIGDEIKYLMLNQGDDIRYDDQTIVQSSEPMQLALRTDLENWRGFVRGDDDYTVNFFPGAATIDSVLFQSEPVPFIDVNGRVTVNFSGQGDFALYFHDETGVWEGDTAPQIHVNISAYPNPFVDQLNIRFVNPQRQRVQGILYDVTGRRVARIIDDEYAQGAHEIRWSGEDSPLRSGVYIFRLTAGHVDYHIKLARLTN